MHKVRFELDAGRDVDKQQNTVAFPGGVAFERMDGAYLGSIVIAQHKAVNSANFPISTRRFGELAFGKEGKPGILPGIANFPGIVTFAGGLPIMTANNVQIGAIGVSGGTSDQDEQCAQAGIDAVKGELT